MVVGGGGGGGYSRFGISDRFFFLVNLSGSVKMH